MALLSLGSISALEQYLQKGKVVHKRIRPATLRHNGKVERVHRMDDERFYPKRTFYSVKDANEQLQRYQRWDNNFSLPVWAGNLPFSIGGGFPPKVSQINWQRRKKRVRLLTKLCVEYYNN